MHLYCCFRIRYRYLRDKSPYINLIKASYNIHDAVQSFKNWHLFAQGSDPSDENKFFVFTMEYIKGHNGLRASRSANL